MQSNPEILALAAEATAVAAERMVRVHSDESSTTDQRNLEAARLLLTSICATNAGAEMDLESTLTKALLEAGAGEEDAPAQAHVMSTDRRCQHELLRTLGTHSDEITGIIPPQHTDLRGGWNVMPWAFMRGTTQLPKEV